MSQSLVSPSVLCPVCDTRVGIAEPYAFRGASNWRMTLSCGHVVSRHNDDHTAIVTTPELHPLTRLPFGDALAYARAMAPGAYVSGTYVTTTDEVVARMFCCAYEAARAGVTL